MINEIMRKKNLTRYQLSRMTGIPYTTINDICRGKADLKKCNADTVYRIAKALEVTMEDLLEPYLVERPDFDLFKSNVCHRLKKWEILIS